MVNDNGVYKRHCAATNLAVSLSIRENGFSRLRRPLLTFVSKKKNYPKEFFNLSIRLKIIYRETTPSCRSLEPKEKGEVISRKNLERNSIDRIEIRFSDFSRRRETNCSIRICEFVSKKNNSSRKRVHSPRGVITEGGKLRSFVSIRSILQPEKEKSILCPQIQLFTRNNGTMTISCKLLTY